MAQTLTTGEFIRRRLRPMGSRLRLRDTLRFASQTLWIGLAGFAIVQVAGRLRPIPNLLAWSIVPPVLWALAVLGYLLLRPLPAGRVAQRVDEELELRERLSTAIELSRQAEQHMLGELQQADARAFAETLRPSMLPMHIEDRRPLLWALAPLAIGIALALLPNPQDAALRERAEVQQALQQTADQTQQLRQQIAQDQSLTEAERASLDKQLADLERLLRENNGSREQALADLSSAESQLQQRVDPNADARRAALENLSRNLQGLSGRQPQQRPSPEQTAQQLQQLAQQLSQMTPEQRQQAAQQLQQQSSQLAQSDPQLAQNLSNAAQQLQQAAQNAQQAQQQQAQQSLQQAQQSLQQAAQNAQQAQQQQAQQQAIQRALSQVQQSRQSVAQAGQQSQQAQQSQQSQQSQQGQQNQQSQQGQQAQQSQQNQQGQQGQQNQQSQQGQGQGQNNQGGGGFSNNQQPQQNDQSTTNSNRGGGQGTGHSDMVYQPYDPSNPQPKQDTIQGQQGQGGETQVQQGQSNLPGAANPALVPYEQQLPRYQRAAGEALDQSAIPPHLKDYVRDYFSNLEPKK